MTRLFLRAFAALAALGAVDLVVRAPDSPLPAYCYVLAAVFTWSALLAGAMSARRAR